jgi:hypothetical protein
MYPYLSKPLSVELVHNADGSHGVIARHVIFGVDKDKPMTKVESRRESWRRSSRKYRATQARERAQSTLFEESGE